MNNHEIIPTLIGAICFIALIVAFLEANKAINKEARRKNNNEREIPDNWHEMNDGSYYNLKN